MSDSRLFTGFPQDALDFLAELKANNNKAWFEANKTRYRSAIVEPAVAFVADLGERLKTIAPSLIYDTRANGGGSLMRIYRDVRFSKDKTPYETNIGIAFWEGPHSKMGNPGFFVHIEPDYAVVYAGLYQFPKEIMTPYRGAVAAEKSGARLQAAVDAVRRAGNYEIGDESLKRVPAPYPADHPRGSLLKYSSLNAGSPKIMHDVITSPAFVDGCFDHCRKMLPLHRWLVDLFEEAAL
jgi:uncharacterized protein (TIGR02453 family)